MRRVLVAMAMIVGVVTFAVRRHPTAPTNKGALAVSILKDVAATAGHDVEWNVHGHGNYAELWQHEPVELRGGATGVVVEAKTWKLDLSFSEVSAVTCIIRGGDVGDTPEYGFITFEPEHSDGAFDALFSIGFPERSIDVLKRLCARHGLPVEH